MADKPAGGLSLRIGLMLSELQSDFLAAEQTVKQGIAALNRQQNIVKLKMVTDITGLDSVAEKTKILEVQEQSLTQLLEMQRDKLKLVTAAYQESAQSKGVNATVTKNLETAMERERLAVARLEAQLKELSAQKISIDTTQLQESISKLNAKIQHVKLTAEIDTSKLRDAGSVFDAQKIHVAALTKELELQRQKLVQLREAMYQSAKAIGGDSVQTLNIKSNVLQQMQEISKLEAKLKELSNTNINLQVRSESLRQAEQTISDSIARINARIEYIRVKTEIDVSKLGSAASEFDKARAHVQSLNRELDFQNQKLAELKKLYGNAIATNGLNNVRTINLQTDIQRQIQEIDRLKAKIDELNNIPPPKTNGLLNGYLNIKEDVANKLNSITSAFQGISQASQSADGAITKSLEIIGAIPHPVGKAVAALASIPLIIKGVESSLIEMAMPAIGSGDAFYVMSRGMQLSIADMAKLSTICKVTGIEINEVNNTLRRFSMQMTKAGEKNSLAIQTLKRYGAEITDENGRLKNAVELAEELGKALKRAQVEGNGAAFRDIVGGKFWSGDFITFLEDFADNAEASAKIVKNGLANPALAHSVQGNINAMNTQAGQLGGAFASALMPVVNEIVPRLTERLGELTKVIAANKENIKFLGDAMAVPVRIMNEFTEGIVLLSNAIDVAKDKGTTLGKVFESYGEYRDDLAALMNVAPLTALTTLTLPIGDSTDLAIAYYQKEIEEYKANIEKAEQEAQEKAKALQEQEENALALNRQNLENQQKLETAVSSMEERHVKSVQEAEDIIYKIRHGTYENSLRDLDKWKEEQLKAIDELNELGKNIWGEEKFFEEDRLPVYELAAAKQLQIEYEKETRLAEIRQRISDADKTELEKRMIAIEDEKDAWIAAGMEKVEAESLAQKQLSEYIKSVEEELSANIEALHQTDLEKRIAQIEREKQAWIDKGASASQAEQLAQEKIRQENQKTTDKLNQIRNSVASLYKTDLENKLDAIEKEKQAWIEAGMAEVEAKELAQQKIQHIKEEYLEQQAIAEAEYLDKLAKAEEEYQRKVQAAQEEAERKNKALRDEALNVAKQEAKEFEAYLKGGYEGLQKVMYNNLIKSGVDPKILKAMTPEKLDAYKNAKEKAEQSFLPNWEDPYSPNMPKKSVVEIPDILVKVPQSAENTARSLDNLATSADKAANNLGGGGEPFAPAENVWTGDSDGAVASYRQPDGSVKIENYYDDVKKQESIIEVMGSQNESSNYADLEQSSQELSTAVQSTTESLGELPTIVQGVSASLSEIMGRYSELPDTSAISQSFSEMPTVIQTAIDSFRDLPITISDVTEKLSSIELPQFYDMSQSVQEVTVRINDFSNALSNFLGNANYNGTTSEQKTPVNVNTSVQIEEAHAWDYDHIQELAEKVADIIKPAIISAIGGDSNSY